MIPDPLFDISFTEPVDVFELGLNSDGFGPLDESRMDEEPW